MSEHAPLLTYFGGYGPGDYRASVEMFARAVAIEQRHSELNVVFVPHPGGIYPTDVERAIFEAAGANVAILDDETMDATMSAAVAAVSNATASQASTCGMQSLAIGVPAMYVAVVGDRSPDTQLGAALGLAPIARNESEVSSALQDFREAGWRFNASRVAEAGVPRGSAGRIASALLEAGVR